MAEKDQLQRFIFDKMPIRGELIHLDLSYRTIINQHPYPLPIKRLLGEALAAAALLSAIIKFEGRVTVQFRGKGKLKLLLAQCDNHFNLRALAKYSNNLTHETLMQSFNDGVLAIMLDSGFNKNPYQGIVAWRGNSLSESIEGYFQESEQLATKIALAVDDHKAAGLLIQVVPAANKHAQNLETASANSHWNRISTLTSQANPDFLLTQDSVSLLQKVYPHEEIRLFPPVAVKFRCSCSRKRGEDAILLLGKKEAEAELKSNHTIIVTCDFCNEEYFFDPGDVAKIFESNDKPSDIQLH